MSATHASSSQNTEFSKIQKNFSMKREIHRMVVQQPSKWAHYAVCAQPAASSQLATITKNHSWFLHLEPLKVVLSWKNGAITANVSYCGWLAAAVNARTVNNSGFHSSWSQEEVWNSVCVAKTDQGEQIKGWSGSSEYNFHVCQIMMITSQNQTAAAHMFTFMSVRKSFKKRTMWVEIKGIGSTLAKKAINVRFIYGVWH